jgi:hypothetical protein
MMKMKKTRFHSLVKGISAAMLVLSALSVQAADDALNELRNAERQLIRSSDVGTGYAAIINFASEPNISSSTLWIDHGLPNNDELSVTKFPLRYEFDLTGRSWKPFVQGTLAKLKLEQTYPVFEGEKIKPEWTSYSASIGGGVRIPLTEGWSVLPAAEVGYASLSSDVRYTGEVGKTFLQPVLDEILFDWSVDAWLANGHLALQYQGSLRDLEIDAKLSGTLSHIESFRTTTDLQEFSEDIGTLSFKVDGTYPLGISLAGHPLSVIGHLGSSTLVGGNRDVLGFTYINEAGLSLQADVSRHGLPVSKVSLGAMALWGDNVKGWSMLFGYKF